ncbi:hypothetical protein ACFFRR_006161 [Megaselia abdita]
MTRYNCNNCKSVIFGIKMTENDESGIFKFLDDIGIGNIAHLFANLKNVSDMYELQPKDVDDLVSKEFIAEKLILRKFLFTSSSLIVNKRVAFNLKQLIDEDPKARYFPQRQEQTKALDKDDSNRICTIIKKFWLSHDHTKPGNEDYAFAWCQIQRLFPMESKSDYISTSTSKKRGKLQERMYYATKSFKKFKKKKEILMEISCEADVTVDVQDDDQLDSSNDGGQGLSDDVLFLKENYGPLEKCQVLWEKHFQYLKTQDLTIELFKCFQGEDGHKLITMHFNMLFENKGDRLILNFFKFKERVVPILKKNLKNELCKEFLQKFHSGGQTRRDENLSVYYVLQSLHGYLTPVITASKKITKKTVRATMVNSIMYFITEVKSVSEINTKINQYNENKKAKGEELGPMVFIIISNEQLEKCVTYISGQTYQVPSVLEAISICFQAHYVFQKDYNEDCKVVWRFIEAYFFQMEKDQQNLWEHSSITNLIKLL